MLVKRMVRVVLMFLSAVGAALTPDPVAVRRVPVEKSRSFVRPRR